MTSSVASPKTTEAAPAQREEDKRRMLQDSGFIRLDGIGIMGDKLISLTFNSDEYVSGASNYQDGVGMIVLGTELWFRFLPRDETYKAAVELCCPRGHVGSMRVPITLNTTPIVIEGILERLKNPDWNP